MANFRPIDRQTGFLLPPSVDEWLPERHLARFVVEVSLLDATRCKMNLRRGKNSRARKFQTSARQARPILIASRPARVFVAVKVAPTIAAELALLARDLELFPMSSSNAPPRSNPCPPSSRVRWVWQRKRPRRA